MCTYAVQSRRHAAMGCASTTSGRIVPCTVPGKKLNKHQINVMCIASLLQTRLRPRCTVVGFEWRHSVLGRIHSRLAKMGWMQEHNTCVVHSCIHTGKVNGPLDGIPMDSALEPLLQREETHSRHCLVPHMLENAVHTVFVTSWERTVRLEVFTRRIDHDRCQPEPQAA